MKVKALKEKRNEFLKQASAIYDKAVEEVRAITPEEKTEIERLEGEARNFKETIEMLEKRSDEEIIVKTAEVEEMKEEKRSIEQEIEMETRAVEKFIKQEYDDEVRAMTAGSTGGIMVPKHLFNEVVEKLHEVAPIFSMARTFTPVNGTLEILREDTLGDTAWVGEMSNLTPSDFSMDKVTLEQRRCGTAIELSQQLVNDGGIDVVAYSKNLLLKRLGWALDRTVVSGTTSNKQFQGLLSADEECHVEAAAKTATTIDDYIEVYNNMHQTLQEGAIWIMSRKEFNHLSKLKDQIGHYYIISQVVDGKPQYRLLGLPIYITDAISHNTGAGNEKVAILVNMGAAYATMIKKGAELKHITNDSTQALRGSHLLLLDIYADGKIYNEQAIRILVTPAS